MKFAVLALDYDGTVAEQGVLNPRVREAIAELRARGIVVVLATGRRIPHLESVAGDLRFVDGVVAENGALVAFPQTGRTMALGHCPSPGLLHALSRRGVDWVTGECVIEAAAAAADEVSAAIRELELPLVVLFNRGRLMVLPQGISKATGLRELLRVLRLSEHNAVAIGDAENDHALLEACELGVAVGWGSPALQAAADEVLRGEGPAAVADYLRLAAAWLRLPPERLCRRQVVLGSDIQGRPVALVVRGRNVLVAGDARSGKSWLAGLLCEQLILQRYCVCVIDPEGDYRALEALPGVLLLGGHDPPPLPREIVRALSHPDRSVVIDLSPMSWQAKREYVAGLLPLLAVLRRRTGLPHRVVLDEAHYFLQGGNVGSLLDLDLAGYTWPAIRWSPTAPRRCRWTCAPPAR